MVLTIYFQKMACRKVESLIINPGCQEADLGIRQHLRGSLS